MIDVTIRHAVLEVALLDDELPLQTVRAEAAVVDQGGKEVIDRATDRQRREECLHCLPTQDIPMQLP